MVASGAVRARHVPVRAVSHGDSRSLADNRECALPRRQQVTRGRPPPLQASGHGGGGRRGRATARRRGDMIYQGSHVGSWALVA